MKRYTSIKIYRFISIINFLSKAWAAAAKAAREKPDPMSDIYNANSNKLDEEQSEADQAMEIISGVANQQQSLSRYPNLPYTNHIKPDEEGAFSHDSVVVETVGEARDNKKIAQIRLQDEVDEVEPSNPRGFFYNFDYPVELILANSDEQRQQRSISTNEKSIRSSPNDESELSSPLEVEVAEYKIVKRSENIEDAVEVKGELDKKAIAEAVNTPELVGASNEEQNKLMKKESEKDREVTDTSIKSQSKSEEAEIPVIVKVESEEPPSEVFLKSELELRRLATNEDVIDAVHDTQVHRHENA